MFNDCEQSSLKKLLDMNNSADLPQQLSMELQLCVPNFRTGIHKQTS